jgi:hypothetical protein
MLAYALDPSTQVLVDTFTPIIVNAVVAAIGIVVAAVGVQVRKVQASTANNHNADFINKVIEIGVQAAEQVYGAAEGDQKKAYAIDFAEKWLADRGVKVDIDILDSAVEAAVMREFNYPTAVEPAAPPTETTVTMPGGDATTSVPA